MIRCLKNFSESELEVNQGKEFLRVTSTDPGISISQNRAKIKTAMSWIKNRDESVNNAKHITMTNEVRKLHDRGEYDGNNAQKGLCSSTCIVGLRYIH